MTVYAEVGASLQQIGGTCPDGWVAMRVERPSQNHVASLDGEWVLSDELVIGKIRDDIQRILDSEAAAYGYDDVKTAVTYAEEPAVPRFQAEGRAFRARRSAVWAHAYSALDAVKAGERQQTTAEELISELPPLIVDYGTN